MEYVIQNYFVQNCFWDLYVYVHNFKNSYNLWWNRKNNQLLVKEAAVNWVHIWS